VKERIRGGSISGAATLLLDGDIHLENVTVADGATLVISAVPGATVTVRDLTVSSGATYLLEELTDAEMASDEVPEYLRIRGYRITGPEVKAHSIAEPGRWTIGADGQPNRG